MFSFWKGSEFGPEVKNHVYLLMIFIFILMISLILFPCYLYVFRSVSYVPTFSLFLLLSVN